MAVKSWLISIIDVYSVIEILVREHFIFRQHFFKENEIRDQLLNRKFSFDYNFIPFVQKVLDEIFKKDSSSSEADLINAVRLLYNDGLDQDVARNIATIVYGMLVDIISQEIPELHFNDPNVICNCVDIYDIMVTY